MSFVAVVHFANITRQVLLSFASKFRLQVLPLSPSIVFHFNGFALRPILITKRPSLRLKKFISDGALNRGITVFIIECSLMSALERTKLAQHKKLVSKNCGLIVVRSIFSDSFRCDNIHIYICMHIFI